VPLAVHVPVRIRLDLPALLERRDLLEEALAAATGRALGNAAAVLAEDAPGLPARLNPPEVRWSGDGLAAVPAALRDEVEAVVAAVLGTAAAGQPGLAAAASGQGGPGGTWSAEGAAERFDPARYDPATGEYTIPSYQEGGAPTKALVLPAEDEPEVGGPARRRGWRTVPFTLSNYDIPQLAELLMDELARRGEELPEDDQLGVLARLSDDTLFAVVWQYPGGKDIFADSISNPKKVSLDAAHQLSLTEVELLPSADFTLRWYANGDQSLEVARNYFGSTIRDEAQRTLLETWKPEEVEGLVEKRLGQLAQAMAGNECFLELVTDEPQKFVLTKPLGGVPAPEDLDARLIPLTEKVTAKGAAAAGVGGGARGGVGSAEARRGAGRAGGEGTEGAEGGEAATKAPEGPAFVTKLEGKPEGGGMAFPSIEGGRTVTLGCEAWEGEPSLQELGASAQLRGLLKRIAYELQIPECEYAAMFLLNAAAALNARAWGAGLAEVPEPGSTRSVAAGTGNLGAIQMAPAPSAIIQIMRHLARVTPLIRQAATRLSDELMARQDLIRGTWHGQGPHWKMHFWRDLDDGVREAVGTIFMLTCRVMFLQLLKASRKAIEEHSRQLDHYARLFEGVVVPYLFEIDELTQLREKLRRAQALGELARINRAMAGAHLPSAASPPAGTTGEAAAPKPATWEEAIQALTDALSPVRPVPAGGASPPAGEILQEGQRYRIRDRTGRVWDLEGLERAIMLLRGTAESFEPLVKQLVELDEVVKRLRDPDVGVKAVLEDVLMTMWQKNGDIIEEAKSSAVFAFRSQRIIEDAARAMGPGPRFTLTGIHQLAHEQIGEFFEGDHYYALGVQDLLIAELGRREIWAFFEFTGLTVLSILCPPLGVVAGIGTGLYHYAEAREKERIYQALIDPELVISRAEVEAELFGAKLGAVLSFLPVAVELGAAAKQAFRVVGTEAGIAAREAAAGARTAAKLAEEASRLYLTAEEAFIKHLATELAENWVADQVISLTLTPIMEQLDREWGTTGPIGGLDRAIAKLLERAEQRRARAAAAQEAGR
jgi:hypothetical protein